MGKKSWAVTLVPLVVYLLGFGYSLATGTDFTTQQTELLQGMLYAFIGSGAIGGGVAIASKLKN